MVIISLVRSNSSGSTGFLSDNRRLNVAVSRARRCCCVIADSATVTKQKFIEDMVDYFCQHANLISPTQIMDLPEWEDLAKKAGFVANVRQAKHDHFEVIDEPKPDKKPVKKQPVQHEETSNKPKKGPKSKLEKKIEKSIKEKNEPATEPNPEIKFESKQISMAKPFSALPEDTGLKMVTCLDCQKSLPAENLELHQIHCKRLQAMVPISR